MTGEASFQQLLGRVRGGDEQAAAELVKRYEPAIRREVRFRLRDARLARLFDSTDVCQSVLASFFLRAALGEYELESPEQLMKLLSVLGVSLTLQEEAAAPAATRVPAAKASKPKATKPERKAVGRQPEVAPASRRTLVARSKKGSW